MDCFPSNPQPTQAGFVSFFRTATGIPTSAIADNSVFFTYAFDVAVAIVNPVLNATPGPIYMLAVYNLATDNVINWAQDVPNSFYPSPPAPPNTPYFAWIRKEMDISGFVPGVISASFDQGTGQSMTPLEQYSGYTLANLQNTKTPYGRAYLAFAASVGTLWGIS